MTKEEAIEFIAQSVKSDVDMAKVADAIKALKQEPIKNHLGVDCVSREQALVAIRNLYPGMPRVDFNGSLRKWVDKYKPYIECEDAIKELSPVTPIKPKGHWIGRKKVGFGEWRDVTVLVNLKGCVTDSCECSECGDWLTGSDEYECSARYCPNCGAEMESEVEE